MSTQQLNPYERLQQPIYLDEKALRHRAALITICTPVLLMMAFGLGPTEMPLMSLAVAKKSPIIFWKLMSALIFWAALVYAIDLSLAFANRRVWNAEVNQGKAYDAEVWLPPFDADEEPYDGERAPPADPKLYEKWGEDAQKWREGIAKAEDWLMWFTRLWFPAISASLALWHCFANIFC